MYPKPQPQVLISVSPFERSNELRRTSSPFLLVSTTKGFIFLFIHSNHGYYIGHCCVTHTIKRVSHNLEDLHEGNHVIMKIHGEKSIHYSGALMGFELDSNPIKFQTNRTFSYPILYHHSSHIPFTRTVVNVFQLVECSSCGQENYSNIRESKEGKEDKDFFLAVDNCMCHHMGNPHPHVHFQLVVCPFPSFPFSSLLFRTHFRRVFCRNNQPEYHVHVRKRVFE